MRMQLMAAATLLLAIPGLAIADEQAAIDGCIDQIRTVGGPDGAGGEVISTEGSEAGYLIMLRDGGGTLWRCIAYNDGSVGELSVEEAMDDGEGAMDGAADMPVMADERPASETAAQVQFERGTSSITLEGAIRGHENFDYSLGASAGQTMDVDLVVDGTNGYGIIYFNILPPRSTGKAIHVGSLEGNSASVRLPETGDYVIRLYLMGNDRDTDKTVGYDLNVTIR
ncbi:hypothetical protein [Pelagibacterium sp.]|uniref:hypothetical protein n=1 Tax=Pelagibacterium sp. TaxID=1967288 RepID=UPI003A925D3E